MAKMKTTRIGNRVIGAEHPVFVIAEAGVNHNGKVNLAKKLIDTAKKIGADAVKFQVFKAEAIVTKTAEKAAHQKRGARDESQYEMLKKLELTEDEFKQLAAHAKRRNIVFLASAYDKESVDLLDELNVPAFKVPSAEITNLPLLKHIARKGKPVIISTGMSNLGEIKEALEAIKDEGVKDIILLHCVSNYPVKVEEVNLRAMKTLTQTFGLPVGFSDHTLGITVPIAAVVLGAAVIEKHFTLDRTLPGPDHMASLEPAEFRQMVNAIRGVEKALGDGIKRQTRSEDEVKKALRKSVVAKVEIPRGTTITEKMLDVKRPGTGMSPRDINKIIGRKAKKRIKPDELITFQKLM